jgi:hypothetical protein
MELGRLEAGLATIHPILTWGNLHGLHEAFGRQCLSGLYLRLLRRIVHGIPK